MIKKIIIIKRIARESIVTL